MDRSHYFKGLLILSKIDEDVTHHEKEILKKAGESLGFNKEFCDKTINDVIRNKHIKNEPLKFSNTQIANMFLRDAIKLAYSDYNLDDSEYHWILKCARINGVSEVRIKQQLENGMDSNFTENDEQLDVINYDWRSFFLPEVKIIRNEKLVS